MGGTAEAQEARRSAIAKIVAASPSGWRVADVRRQLESDYGIVVVLSPTVYRDLRALGISPPKRAGEARRSAIAKIVAASPGGWTVADVRRQLESDYGIVVSLGPLYRDLKALNITPPTGAKPAAGYQRMTFDLPEALYEQLKIAAVLERRPMRELFEEATREWLEMHGK